MRRAYFFIVLLAFVAPALVASSSYASDRLWTGSPAAEARTEALLNAIRAAGDHGLKPEWYRIAELEKAAAPDADKNEAERLLTDALVAYAGDVSTGRVRANAVDRDIDIPQRRLDRAEFLKDAANASDFAAWLAALPPKGDYPVLQKTLATLREKRTTATFTRLPDGEALKPGMVDARVPLLRKRLAELEMTVPPPGAVTELYDEPLVELVKQYQEAKGLTVDGVIGAKTIRSLNTSLDDRIDQVIANLERRRWLPADLGSRYVLVNAADYSMVFVDGGQPVFRSLVIVGTPRNPTPEIVSTMRGFQINPYWTVPQSIAGEEYLPLLRRDPHALEAAGFRIFESWSDDTSEINPDIVDWSLVNPRAFPFRIRQDPGPGNALGYIFFPFSNRYGIYMHDTATRSLFSEGSRNFSHGCIRLQNPLDFVEKVYGGRGGFDKERVRAAIEGGQQLSFTFPEPVRLYVTYRTVTAGPDGTVTFRDDIYGRDRRVVQAMGQPRS
ncbi:L,D-transpeptidase family protein [Enhydrobacter sp.]|uniref:L,D-transpeptidase family protein n=1 Tax=Enhydrobacter sp. TaxID=1894999 RepID=UPI00262CFE8F|nr:L,D-transpeptidase family protein [Enhydrobacter sp.]